MIFSNKLIIPKLTHFHTVPLVFFCSMNNGVVLPLEYDKVKLGVFL